MSLREFVRLSQKVAIVCHIRPDGDALGSSLVVKEILDGLNIACDVLCDSDLPEHFNFIKHYDLINCQKLTEYDTLIALDCADEMRLGKYSKLIGKCRTLNIDHHITNTKFGLVNFVEPNYCSTCQVLYGMLKADNFDISPDIAYNLFVGLSTDTGHFMHDNTTAEVFKMAEELLSKGVNCNDIATNIYRRNTLNKTKLIGVALKSLRMYDENSLAIMSISTKDLTNCGCELADTEGLIDFALNIASVDVAVIMTQHKQNMYKVSFRSKSNVNVANIAGFFGGGGHIKASGCVVCGFYEDCVDKVLKAIRDYR